MTVVVGTPFGEVDLVEAARLPPDEVLARLGSGPDGLSSDDAAERLRQFGPNALSAHLVRATAVLFRQIRNPILVLLLDAALVSGLTGGGTNAVIIVAIAALSIALGFFNEYRAEVAMASLRCRIRHEAEARRDGRATRVPVTDLVPGDVVSLRIGSLVPADLRLLKVHELECNEGVLTGEAMPVSKSVTPLTARGWTSQDARSWGRSCTRDRPLASWSGAGPGPPSGRSRRDLPRSRARLPSRWACPVSRDSCSRSRPR